MYHGRTKAHIIHNQLTRNDLTVWTFVMQHKCNMTMEQLFIDFKGRVISVAAGWLQCLMPRGCNTAKGLHFLSCRGGTTIHEISCCQSLVRMRASRLCGPPRLGWHSAENTSPDTELSGSSCSSCQGWAAHPLIAITVSWPTFTSADMAAYVQSHTVCPPLMLALLTLKRNCWEFRFSRLSGHKLRRKQRGSWRINPIKLQPKRLVSTWSMLRFVVASNTIYSRMTRQWWRPRPAHTPLPVS